MGFLTSLVLPSILFLSVYSQSPSELISTLHFKPSAITKSSILSDHEKLDDKFHNPNDRESIIQLAYITPWNKDGYRLAEQTAHKLTHVAPVWFQLKSVVNSENLPTCKIEGLHEINRDWIAKLYEKNENIKLVPRILFDGWSSEEMSQFLNDVGMARECFKIIAEFYSRNQFSGAVVEFYMQALMATQSLQAKELIIENMQELKKQMSKFHLEVIFTVPAPLEWNNQPNNMVTPEDYRQIVEAADFVQIMTYDYHGPKPAGVAPYEWFENCIFYLTKTGEKTLAGLNFYGYEYSTSKVDSITGNRYLEILRSEKSVLDFDESSMEHRLRTQKSLIYFPSMSSLELRINMAHRYNIGIAIWDYGQGLDYFTNLLV